MQMYIRYILWLIRETIVCDHYTLCQHTGFGFYCTDMHGGIKRTDFICGTEAHAGTSLYRATLVSLQPCELNV